MKIVTSYFAKQRAFEKEGYVAISVSRYSPKWFRGPVLIDVAPTSFMLSGACNHEEYLRKYDEILRKLNPKSVVDKIEFLSRGKDVALCCYEVPGDFCHRHLLADWLNKNGYEVKEFETKEDREASQQLSLFD